MNFAGEKAILMFIKNQNSSFLFRFVTAMAAISTHLVQPRELPINFYRKNLV